MSDYFILEHPERGIVHTDNELGERIKFTRADSRADEKCMRFYSAGEAERYRQRIGGLDPASNRPVALKLKIRRSVDFDFLCLSCRHWIAEYPPHHLTTDHDKHCPARGIGRR